MNLKLGLLAIFAATLSPYAAIAELTVASPFTNHAILQRDAPVPIWGQADPAATVIVEFAGQTKTAKADINGKWSLKLDPMPASFQARGLKVVAGDSEIVLDDILVGEVWICSGQSNMQMAVGAAPGVQALVPKAKHIRCFEVKRTVAMTEQDRCEGSWSVQRPNSAVAFSFAYFLQKSADAPVGIILACWGSSSLEAWMPRDMTETVPHFKTMMAEFDADTKTRERIISILNGKRPWSRQDDIFLRRQTNILYNAMIHPLAPYGCRGLVWYQGERNTQSMFGMLKDPWYSRNSGMLKYGKTLKQWILRYRKEWNNDEMRFLTVMLPGFHKQLPTGPKQGPEHPDTHSWAWMRESQLKSLELPHAWVANTIDLGDVKNIHPKDKLPVGQRLALLAAHDTLNKNVEAIGPMMKEVKVRSANVVVSFDHATGLTTNDGEAPSGFWLSDEAGKWFEAEAKIEGQTVVLNSPQLPKPRYVRYAFAGKPKVNLVNAAGLPTYPFRSDSFSPPK